MVSSATLKDSFVMLRRVDSKSVKSAISSAFNLGIGECVSRLATFLFFAYISRSYGVELLGIIALAQTVAMYVTLGTDQGLRLVGARLVSRHGGSAPLIMRAVLFKRLTSCAVCVSLGCVYALYGPVPQSARLYILGFVLGVVPYAFSLDWLAWGLNKFAWLGGFRGGVAVTFLIGSLLGMSLAKSTLLPLTIANAFAAMAGAACLWIVWRSRWKKEVAGQISGTRDFIQSELRWMAIVPLGMATILNQAFHCFDTVLLGAMSTTAEVGRYSAAYKILFLILGVYWLLTNSLYPKLSSAKAGPTARHLLLASLVMVATVGTILALVACVFAPDLLRLVYGSDLGATMLLRILLVAIPMDFCVALLTIVFVSRGLDRAILVAIGSAAATNILFNLYLIPRYQAMGAAWATLVSYVYLVVFLLQYTIRKPVFASGVIAITASAT